MKNGKLNITNVSLTIGWLYPSLMSTYGDRGNIMILQKRSAWRGIKTEVLPITPEITKDKLSKVNMLFGGGAQDREQTLVINDLKNKADCLIDLIDQFIPSLFVCGSHQLLGKFYELPDGKKIEGLGIFDMETSHPGKKVPRLTGNIVAKVNWKNLDISQSLNPIAKQYQHIVGFENHGGRTVLGSTAKPFATVIKGYGNNGQDKTEGIVYKNAIGCYFHGPLLPKNPHIADYLIQKALEVKYQEEIILPSLDDSLEIQAHNAIVKRLGIKI